jgi:hypothetical protein
MNAALDWISIGTTEFLTWVTASKDTLAAWADLMTLIGIPVGMLLFVRQKRYEQYEWDWDAYDALDERYADYLRLCLENPDLDVFDQQLPQAAGAHPRTTPTQKELIAFSLLISLFERAFLLRNTVSRAARRAQWTGWETYMREWKNRPLFRAAWGMLHKDFDGKFTRFFDKL